MIKITTAGATHVIRGDHPHVPEAAFTVRPGLAEQVAQLIEAYDALVEDGIAAVAERLSSKGKLPTMGQVDYALAEVARDRVANAEAYAAERAESAPLFEVIADFVYVDNDPQD